MAQQLVPYTKKLQLIKGDRHLFSCSDDSVVMKQILATHSPDGRDLEVRPILNVIEDILNRASPSVVLSAHAQIGAQVMDDKALYDQSLLVGTLEALDYTIHRISCEISCKCTAGATGGAHATTVALFNLLSNYTWDAKVVLALAALAMSYGEFWLTAQLHTVNPLAKSVSLLKQLPDILEHVDTLRPRFEALDNLIKAMLQVTECIIQLKELPADYISPDTPAMIAAMAHIPTAAYWTLRSVVACASQIISLMGVGHEHISATTEAWELSSLEHKVKNIHEHLMKQLALCKEHIEKEKEIAAYRKLVLLFDLMHMDNLKILKALLQPKDIDLPLFDSINNRKVSVDSLWRKTVVFLISDLDISNEEVLVLATIFNESHQGRVEKNYEVVWLPIVDKQCWDSTKQITFERISSAMPWYSFHNPALVEPAVIKYIRSAWHFEKKPLLVVTDPQGKVVCPNAFPMIWIWGTLAFPFTTQREESLWKEETWKMEFLVDEIDPTLLTWVKQGQFICLYGGEDIEWIRSFTTLMKSVAQEAGIQLEMLYVGKSNPKERIKRVGNTIAKEGLSSYWNDPFMMWLFWVRLESMWLSKMQHGCTVENDNIMQEVFTMMSFDSGDEGWALISHGSTDMVKAPGKKLVSCLNSFETWKENAQEVGFFTALQTALEPYHTREHCTRLILPTTNKIQENVVCGECKRTMERYILFRCCND